MAGPISLPLYEKLPQKNTVQRVLDVTIFVLLLTLLAYRILSLKSNGFSWLLALLCESWFTFVWVVILSSKWNPVVYRTYPERLLFWYLNNCLSSTLIIHLMCYLIYYLFCFDILPSLLHVYSIFHIVYPKLYTMIFSIGLMSFLQSTCL